MVLQTKKLDIGYEKKDIATQIDIEIPDEGLTAIIGVNGSGKSTLIKSIGNLLPSINGEIKIFEKSIADYKPSDLARKMSFVLTKQHLPQHLKVIDFVSLGRQPYTNWLGINTHHDKVEVINALKKVDIIEKRNQACSTLSDGQLQKVLIARAIAQDTPLILLDEPTSHLDIYHKAMVLKLLKDLSKQHKRSIVFATHEINYALELCDSIILIHNRKVIQDTPKNLIESKILDNLFPKDLIKFDKAQKTFKML